MGRLVALILSGLRGRQLPAGSARSMWTTPSAGWRAASLHFLPTQPLGSPPIERDGRLTELLRVLVRATAEAVALLQEQIAA